MPWKTKMLIFPAWNKISKIWDRLFELIQIEVQCSKNYFKIVLPQQAGVLEITKKRNSKNHAQSWKIMYITYLQTLFALPAV